MSGLRRFLFRLPVLLLAALCVLLPALDALARAGGGEHFSGGGGSRGGGGGGGGGGGDLGDAIWILFQLVRLHIYYPKTMAVVWVVIIVFYLIARRSTPAARTQAGLQRLERRRLVPRADLPDQLAALKGRDPGFDEQAFLARTEKAFLDIQEAWFRRRLEGARHLMSDGLYRRFTTLQGLMTAEGRRDALADCVVRGRRVLELEHTERFDLVSVRVDAAVRDTDVDAKTGDDEARARARRQPLEEFTELWTFVRRPTAQSRTGYDLGQGRCPNCGAPFEGGAANTCAYCKAIVNSGNYDWVLSEITQPSEYLPRRHPPEGLQALWARDPDAAPEILEDRALLLFWKWLEAQASARPDPLRKLATGAGFSRFSEEIARRGDGRRMVVKRPAVGGADVCAVETDVDGFDRVHVDIRWSASLSFGGPPPPTQPRRHVLVMVRAAGAKTDAGVGLATERCGSCNAPLTDSDSTKCDYCGHDLAGAAREWQLEDLVPRERWRDPARARAERPLMPVPAPRDDSELPPFATPGERVRLLQVMASMARADGDVSRQERRLLRAVATRWQVPWGPVEAILRGEAEDPLASLAAPSAEDAEQFLATLVAMARVDGRIDRRERRVLEAVASHLHARPGTVERLLDAA